MITVSDLLFLCSHTYWSIASRVACPIPLPASFHICSVRHKFVNLPRSYECFGALIFGEYIEDFNNASILIIYLTLVVD